MKEVIKLYWAVHIAFVREMRKVQTLFEKSYKKI
jgi:hypothetical protein